MSGFIRRGTHKTTDGRHWDWITNSPKAFRALMRADHEYAQARARAADLPLAEKVEALRKANAAHEAAYDAIAAGGA